MSFLGQRLILISSGEDSGWLKFIFGLCSVFFHSSMVAGPNFTLDQLLWTITYGSKWNWIKSSNWSLLEVFPSLMTNCSGLERVRVDAVISRCHNHDQEGQKFEVCSVRCSNDTVFSAYIMLVKESLCWRLKMLATEWLRWWRTSITNIDVATGGYKKPDRMTFWCLWKNPDTL